MRRVLFLALLLPACSEYDLENNTNGQPLADPDCDVDRADEGEVEIDESCAGEGVGVVEDPWNVAIEWQYTSSGAGVIVMPAVGNLTDDNGDGKVNEDDDPDIAFTTWQSNEAVALDSHGGEIFRVPGYDGQGGVTIADVTGDGRPEVIAETAAGGYYGYYGGSHEIVALDPHGTPIWTSAAFPMQMYPQPAVGDLDGDGDVEVVFDTGVVDGKTGATIATLATPYNSWRTPILADIDADGREEIILGNNVYDSSGAIKWTNPGTGAGNFGAVADIDGDVGGEVFFVSGSSMYVHDDDGTLLGEYVIPGYNPGPPSMADFDGDGDVEIAIPANTTLSVFEIDGTLVWQMPIQDGSGLAGCSGYDVDGDGAYEVLYADETDLRIYDGRDGTVLYDNGFHSSGTVWEYPVVADVDNDGSAEIIVASNSWSSYYGSSWMGITVLGHAGDGWAKSGPTWGTHDFAVTNLNPDGSVPSPAALPWNDLNVFRARPTIDSPGQPDLRVEVTDACYTGCGPDDKIEIAWQVANYGANRSKRGITVALLDGDGTVIDSKSIDSVSPGEKPRGSTFEVKATDLVGPWQIVVDADEEDDECDETNNVVDGDAFCE